MGYELGARFAGEVGSVACVAGARRRVLDIGCGGGANLAQFLKLCPQGSVCGIDFSAESVATSLRKNAGAVARRALRSAAGGCFPAALCRCVLRSRHRFRDGLLLAGCIRRLCRGVPRTRTVRRVFDRERGVRDSRWCSIVDGMRTYTADALAEWLCAVGFVDVRSDVRGEGGALCLVARKGPDSVA